MNRRLGALLSLLVAGMPLPCVGQDLPGSETVPGGIAIVALGADTLPRPAVRFGEAAVMVVRHESQWKAIVGLPLTLAPGEHALEVSGGGYPGGRVAIRIGAKTYPAQHIRLKDKGMVELSAGDLERHYRDREEIQRAVATWNLVDEPPMRLDLPAAGRLSSGFGLKRFFNGQPRAPHSGLDIAAPEGTAVRAPARGTVVAVGDYFFNGKTVLLDHGQGLVSMYNHLRDARVAAGQRVERGQKIGEVGRTGRATGAHLHWSVVLNRASVNPELFVEPATLARVRALSP